METRRLADWLQILGNVGIVIGLIFVGFQLYQDRQLKLADLAAGYFDSRILANSAAMGDEPFKSIVKAAVSHETMTAEDAYIFFLNLDNWKSLDMRSSRMQQLGLYTDSWQTRGLILEAKTEIGLREMSHWLSQGTNFPPEYMEKLQRQLEEPGLESEFKKRLELLLGKPPSPED